MNRKLFLFIFSFLIAVVQAKAASPTELIFPVFDQEVSIAALQFGFGQSLEEPALQSLSGTIQP